MNQELLDRLAHVAASNPDARPLYNALVRDYEGATKALDYEDWTRPMKLSGGDIACLWFQTTGGEYGYAKCERDTLVFAFGDTWTDTGPAAVDQFRQVVADDHFVIEPITADQLPSQD